MTDDELKELTDFEFKCMARDVYGNILFGVPIPGKYGKHLKYGVNETGICIFDPIEAWENAWNAYISDLTSKKSKKEPHRQNRTKGQASKAGAITIMPNSLAIPTLIPFQNAMTTINNPTAHLQPITDTLASNLRFENGTLYFSDMDASRVDLIQYYDKTPQAVSDLDLPTLRALYSIILKDVMDKGKDPETFLELASRPQYLNHSVKIYLPEFLKMLGYAPNRSRDVETSITSKIMSYSRMLGVMEERNGGRIYNNHYPVMQLVAYEATDNTLTISSPYINKIIMRILQASIQTDKKGNPKRSRNGRPFLLPSHSYLIKPSIAKERNKRAVEIVCIVVTLIEQTGNNTPHIKAQTIIERCPDLQNALSAADASDKNKILKRAFTKAWELLPKQTILSETYENIQFPTVIPTASDLAMVFYFPHDGKTKNRKKNK